MTKMSKLKTLLEIMECDAITSRAINGNEIELVGYPNCEEKTKIKMTLVVNGNAEDFEFESEKFPREFSLNEAEFELKESLINDCRRRFKYMLVTQSELGFA